MSDIAIPRVAVIAEARAITTPRYIYLLAFGMLCIPVGVLWDISWHSTVGRDTFWTPAHIVTYLGGLIPGLTCGWLAIKTHFFGTESERQAAVNFWGFRAPLGAWITIWGAFTMILSAPFDDWWHNAYGLDVEILSPPHTVLALGMFGVGVGTLLLLCSAQNRAAAGRAGVLASHESRMVIVLFGILTVMAAIFLMEKGLPNQQHGGAFYKFVCGTFPFYLVAATRAAKISWPATRAAAIYMGINLAMNWTLPLFEAEPKLAPIYNPVDHMVPSAFPLLLIVPAFALDLITQRWKWKPGFWRDWLLGVVLGALFLAILLPAQWYFSEFLLTPAANNWFFTGAQFFPYYANPNPWWTKFWDTGGRINDPLTTGKVIIAAILAILASRLGLGAGNWLSRICR